MAIGYFLSTEEYSPEQLLEQAVLAERAGFDALCISDHFHPWNEAQGQSPFVWSVLGALSRSSHLPVTTTVTCPTARISPVVIAQAAATTAILHQGRFRLGVGSGEALNEHIHGDPWPETDVRLEMLEEAVGVIRRLWTGETVNHRGRYYRVQDARLYTLPSTAPELWVSGFGAKATELAARIGDGYITTRSDPDLLGLFKGRSGGKPALATTKVSWAPTEEEGVRHAHRLWSTSALPGELAQVLPSPRHFEQGAQLVTKEMTRASTVAGPDPARHVDALDAYAELDEVYVANMGPHYRDMIAMYGAEVLPEIRTRRKENAS